MRPLDVRTVKCVPAKSVKDPPLRRPVELTMIKILAYMNDSFDILKIGWTLSLIIYGMLLDDIWPHLRDRNPLNGYSTIKILHCPFNHEVFLSFFHETDTLSTRFPLDLFSPVCWAYATPDNTLRAQARLFRRGAPDAEIAHIDTGITITFGAVDYIAFMVVWTMYLWTLAKQ